MKQQIAVSPLATAQEMRRVVTGLDERNHSVVLFDSKMPLKQVAHGINATNFWITDTYPPSLLKDDPSGRPIGTAPPNNGTKFRVVEFPPLDAATEAKMPPEMLQKAITNTPTRGIPVKHPLMHRTRSLDYAVILSGEIDLMLDDGDVHLKPGRCDRAAGDQPRLDQSRQGAVSYSRCSDGIEGSVTASGNFTGPSRVAVCCAAYVAY